MLDFSEGACAIKSKTENGSCCGIAELNERELDVTLPVRAQLSSHDGKRPSVFLRYKAKDPDREYIRVYPGNLRYAWRICMSVKLFIPGCRIKYTLNDTTCLSVIMIILGPSIHLT